jgi:hypothetical protein
MQTQQSAELMASIPGATKKSNLRVDGILLARPEINSVHLLASRPLEGWESIPRVK